uniref:WW domain-containing protein n=1 Tax=Aplanochytrium stocchinoi TaxID=215587 RepID=A0A7S3PLQ6_9STRA|mmetsp:Transcript_14824/g.18330  ORF Transcript_14824/g.18330 Transcript_14824/m.18330 type:complete len:301 (+) Transcript_14824:229-1131(+)|eukprot:CAMPEP_0204835832 /NCGR_PEP_ID=MMETSP1346-20131115/23769_1 /ASSEMBLY_ACC=CAM_ASM_000771 /TAXON_ID=215587 /ORGANISM="Aplanochytrium stocchinoi, Strain GSBS06" /LENGTH=300 /DNA_ID=CAMNT_0051970173 /DNA_START=198 /DNA_END=1100 /DNA_ORIENTATION=-
MASYDPEYSKQLYKHFAKVVSENSPKEHAEQFKLRYILTLEDDVFVIDDQVQLFMNTLMSDGNSFEYNDPNLTKFLEACEVRFDSYTERNKEFDLLNISRNRRLSFIEFLLYVHREMILDDYKNRWKLSGKIKQDLLPQAILSEFLEQPPFGIDPELDAETKEVREVAVNHANRVTRLRNTVTAAEGKAVKNVKEKQAIQELAILGQGSIHEKLAYIKTQINKRRRKVLIQQKEALRKIYSNEDEYEITNPSERLTGSQAPTARSNQLPPGWWEYTDDETGALYYYNEHTQETTWTKPEH